MRKRLPEEMEEYRETGGPFASPPGVLWGAFQIPPENKRPALLIFSSGEGDGSGWEHVSVSATGRCPTWGEMCYIKSIFWDEEETVLQFHPKRSAYVDNHPFVLHLWKREGEEWALPPKELI